MSDYNLFASDANAYVAGLPAEQQTLLGNPYFMPGDGAEAQRMNPYTPAPVNSNPAAPWWERLVMYGATRAIDNAMPGQVAGIGGNTNPGTFSGQNGRTYQNGAGNQAGAAQPPAAQSSTTTLIIAALVAYLAMA